MDERQARMGACKVLVLVDGVLEKRRCRRVIAAVEAVYMLEAEMIGRPGIEILGEPEASQSRFVEGYLDFQGREDPRTDVLANLMHLADRACEAFCPDHARVPGIDEFDRHGQARTVDLNRAGQAVPNIEQAADLADVGIGSAQAKGRTPRRHEQPAHAGQLRDQVVGQSIRNGRMHSQVANRAEREHGDRGSGRMVGSGSLGFADLRTRGVGPRDLRIRHEAKALPMDGPDVLLGLAVVAENLARRLDTAGHGRV